MLNKEIVHSILNKYKGFKMLVSVEECVVQDTIKKYIEDGWEIPKEQQEIDLFITDKHGLIYIQCVVRGGLKDGN